MGPHELAAMHKNLTTDTGNYVQTIAHISEYEQQAEILQSQKTTETSAVTKSVFILMINNMHPLHELT